MHRRSILLFGLLAMLGGCAVPRPRPVATQPVIPIAPQAITTDIYGDTLPGPTLMAKVPGGYQLSNRLFRIVISDKTGDVLFWGYVNQPRNMVMGRGIYTSLTGLPDAPPQGYVEMRDEQTWQYFGEDANRITWRKIYCLEGDSLFVSVLIQNDAKSTIDTAIQINGELIGMAISHHDPELFTGKGGYGSVTLQGFNERHTPTSRPVLPVLVRSDLFHLEAGKREAYTSKWVLAP